MPRASDYKRRREQLGKLVRERRLDRGWSGKELARRITEVLPGTQTVKQGAVSYWESGRSEPMPEKFDAIEHVLDLTHGTIRAVLDGRPPPPPLAELPTARSFVARIRALLDELEEVLPPDRAAPEPSRDAPGVRLLPPTPVGTQRSNPGSR